MSNRAYLTATKFVDIVSGDSSYGWRVVDGYTTKYWDSYEANEIPEDNLQLLRKVVKSDHSEEIMSLLDHLRENEKGLYINGNYHEWGEVKDILNEEEVT